MIKNKRNGESYFDLIETLPGKRITLEDQAEGLICPGLYHAIRHDIDHDMDKALAFARAESKAGISATYFLLPTAGYFDYSWRFRNDVQELHELGHRIGYHNNVITEWIQSDKKADIKGLIERPLEFLRDEGRPVVGTSSHGGPLCYKHNYINYQVWKESVSRPYVGPEGMEPVSLQEVGLGYEAYFLPRDAYFSDSGGRWQGGYKNKIDRHERNPEGDAVRDAVIDTFGKLASGVMQVLIHPCWWEVEGGQRTPWVSPLHPDTAEKKEALG